MAEPANDATPIRRRSLSAAPRLGQELERFFGDRWPGFYNWPSAFEATLPNVDVVDREEEVFLRAELPGFSKDKIERLVNDGAVTIRAASNADSIEEDGDYYRREISRETVARSVALPAEVDGDKATAKLVDGVLEVTIAKVKKAKRQHVPIES